MSLERIHAMLRLLIDGSGSGGVNFHLNLVELRQYLHAHLDQLDIEVVDTLYSICKK